MHFLYPAAAMVFYIFFVGVYNFRVRLQAVKDGTLKLDYFKILDQQAFSAPEYVVRTGRHYDNQFQPPLLFLITCVVCLFMMINHPVAIGAAWLFVLSRVMHSLYHLGSNDILKRARWFFLGWGVVIVLWCTIIYHHLLLRMS